MFSQGNAGSDVRSGRRFAGKDLLQIAMPMGGIGAGCICFNGHGALQDFSLRHRPATTALPDGHGMTDAAFAVLHVKSRSGAPAITKLLEGPLPAEAIYDQGLQSQGYRKGGSEGLPRFARSNTFEARYPFGIVRLEETAVPLEVTITGWSPFIPRDDVASGIPCAIVEYTLTNPATDPNDEPIEFEFSYHLSHLAGPHKGGWQETRNGAIPAPPGQSVGGGILFTNTAPRHQEDYGSAALYVVDHTPKLKTRWFSGGWFDSLSVLWRELASGAFRENRESNASGQTGRNGGSLLIEGRLAPGESVTYPIVIAWHFPNSNLQQGRVAPAPTAAAADCGPDCDCAPIELRPLWSPFYSGIWRDAQEVALYLATHYSALRARTVAFADALHGSTLPDEAVDAIASNLAILKSPTVLRQRNGNIWGWEGCFTESGCCSGTCTHVWNYAQALPHLFPALERTLREQELLRSMDERGHVNFRSALPDGPAGHGFHAAADGQLGGILKLYRDYRICGDTEWLARLYPAAKRSLDYCIGVWDPDRRGGLFEPHHNTYDIEFWGPDGMCGSIYVAALSAMAALTRALGRGEDEATPYAELAERGARLMDETLFNGEYYQQQVIWRESHDSSLRDQLAKATEEDFAVNESLRLLEQEGPKYQYGDGCLADGIIGGWMAKIYGIETSLRRENIASTLAHIFRYNFRADLWDHACLQRPGYALGHEGGLLLCSWPHGNALTLPFPYSDEVWTGIEYQVASHLIEEGMVEEGLTMVRTARSRYDGRVRNPFNEYECGSYYARAMSSYALLGSLSGFRYSAVDRALHYGPRISAGDGSLFRTFFSTDSGFGTISLDGSTLTVSVIEGEMAVERLLLTRGGEVQEYDWQATVGSGQSASVAI